MPPFTTWFKQQQFPLIVIILLHVLSAHNNNYSLDFLIRRSSNHNYYLHAQRVFTQDWLNSFWITFACYVLRFLLQTKQSNECTWRRMNLPSRNLYKCKQVTCSVVVACLLVYSLFILMLLLYFCFLRFIFICWSCNPVIFVFGNFVYHFNNTISIFVRIYI